MQHFGITETYDPAQNYSWIGNLEPGNILITKNLTDKLIQILMVDGVWQRIILHLTVTGMGGTFIEPNVPSIQTSVEQLQKLLNAGFPIEQIVLRISPVVPTQKGIATIKQVLDAFQHLNIQRIRFSTLNMYHHVKKRFLNNRIPLPYSDYSCNQEMRDNLITFILEYFNITTHEVWDSDICAEVDLEMRMLVRRACLSQKDLQVLNLEDKIILQGSGKQRNSCMCPDNKKQIIRYKPGRCEHKCLYCYWKD